MDSVLLLDLVIHNTEHRPTFIRGSSVSYKILLARQEIAKDIINWEILEDAYSIEH